MPLAYLDGRFVDKGEIKIAPSDFGFARGMALFEFTRLYGGVAFRLEDHLRRFAHGAAFLGIPLPATEEAMTEAVNRIAAANAYPHSGIKFYLTLGECGKSGGFGFKNCADFTPHLMMIEDELHPDHPEAPYGRTLYQRGAALKTVPFARQISEAKTVNYAPGFVAARHLAGTNYDEILYLHPDGHVTETTTSNFFCVIGGVLRTPGRNMLRGVTRGVLLELARDAQIQVLEGDIAPKDLHRASEAFITGSFLEMLPVRMIDDIPIATSMESPVFARLRKGFTAAIADYCRAKRA
jgi:branched-chain amino acid aminotransferase